MPALNQLALAVGIFLLLPLGDRYSNRSLAIAFASGQTIALAVMTLASSFTLFTIGSTLLGFFTIAPYLLPAYASKRIAPERLGSVTALLSAGVVFGILVARVAAGVIAEFLGWQLVYWIATGMMALVTISLPRLMDSGESSRAEHGSYAALLGSIFRIGRQHPEVFLSGAIQALNFGGFIAVWLGLALHLTSPEMGYGTDSVGYLAAIAAVSIFSTPMLGRWADRVGPRAYLLRPVVRDCPALSAGRQHLPAACSTGTYQSRRARHRCDEPDDLPDARTASANQADDHLCHHDVHRRRPCKPCGYGIL